MTDCQMRVSLSRVNGLAFLKEFEKWDKAKIKRLICGFETKDKEGEKECLSNPHIHLHIEYSNPPTKQALSSFMKQFKELNEHNGQLYYHKKAEDSSKSLAYVIKDGDILMNKGFTEEEIEKAEERNQKIDKDKKSASFMKIANRIREDKTMYGNTNAEDLMKYIFKLYTKEFKSELSMSRCKSLAYQVFIELGYMDSQFESSLFSY